MCGNCGCGHQEEPRVDDVNIEEVNVSSPVQEELTEMESCGDDCGCGCNH